MKIFNIAVAMSLLLAFLSQGEAAGFNADRSSLSKLLAENQKIARQTKSLQRDLQNITDRTLGNKRAQEENYSIFREFTLQSLYKDAKEISDKISSIVMQQYKNEKLIKQIEQNLFLEYNREIDRLLAAIKNNPLQSSSLLPKLKTAMIQRSRFEPSIKGQSRGGFSFIYTDPADTEIDLSKKAAILNDYKYRVRRDLYLVESRISELKKQNYALREISHLVEEEDFFTETGFLKAVKRKDSGDSANLSSKISDNSTSVAEVDPSSEAGDVKSIASSPTPKETAPSALDLSSEIPANMVDISTSKSGNVQSEDKTAKPSLTSLEYLELEREKLNTLNAELDKNLSKLNAELSRKRFK